MAVAINTVRLHRLRLRAFSDSLHLWRLSSLCSTHFGSGSAHALRCTLEIIAFRHRLALVNRSRHPRLHLTAVDRMDAVRVALAAPSEAGDRPSNKQNSLLERPGLSAKPDPPDDEVSASRGTIA